MTHTLDDEDLMADLPPDAPDDTVEVDALAADVPVKKPKKKGKNGKAKKPKPVTASDAPARAPAEPPAPPAPAVAASRRSAAPIIVATLAVLAMLGMLVALVLVARSRNDLRNANADRNSALAAAKVYAEEISTFDYQ